MTRSAPRHSPTPALPGTTTRKETELLATLAEAIAATREYQRLRGGGVGANPERDRAQWRCVETWVAAVTEVRVAALQALPEGLHVLL